ncbi:MAG: hypothetical protein U0R24_00520 [Solirubrobacterales bacterium]
MDGVRSIDLEVSDRRLVMPGILAVAATFSSDPAESNALLRRLLEAERLQKFGFQEMPDLAAVVERLLEHDHQLVQDIYATTFDFEETSDEKTNMGGIILSLTSNRRQDYGHALYRLAEAYPAFLEAAPSEAVQALIAVRLAYARRKSSGSTADDETLTFAWDLEREAQIVGDGSYIWDEQPFEHDDEVKILGAFERRLDELADSDPDALATLIDPLIGPAVPAAIWRRVLLAAGRSPEALGQRIEPLLVSRDVMASVELTTVLGEMLRSGFNQLDDSIREQIENNVIGLPEHYASTHADRLGDHAVKFGEEHRDRLLGCLGPDSLLTEAAKTRLTELLAADDVPENRPPVSFSGWSSREYGEREALAEEGVDVDAAPNIRLQTLEEPVKEFATKHQNGSPSMEEAAGIEQPLRSLWEAIESAESDGADERQRDHAWGCAAEVAEAISRATDLTCDSSMAELAREILLSSVAHPNPKRRPESDEQFDRFPSWGSPAPRVEAAGGLVCLAHLEDCAIPEVLDAIEKLSRDEVPAVRLHVAQRLHLLRAAAPELMWQVADRIAEQDESRAVTTAVITILPRIAQDDNERMRNVAKAVYAKTDTDAPGGGELRNRCVELLTDLHVWRGDDDARHFLDEEVIGRIDERSDETRHLVLRVRDAQTYGGDQLEHTAIRARAIKLLSDVVKEAVAGYREIEQALRGMSGLTDEDPEVKRGRGLAQTIDTITHEIYFASGAFDDKQGEPSTVSRDQRERLYSETKDVLNQLSQVPVPSVTHNLLETLEVFIEFDPRDVFLRIGQTILAGKPGGYQFDGMAVDLFVRLVERYLADYRTLLQQDDEARNLLIEMLDVFVDAGWPKARQLTYGLHELFR